MPVDTYAVVCSFRCWAILVDVIWQPAAMHWLSSCISTASTVRMQPRSINLIIMHQPPRTEGWCLTLRQLNVVKAVVTCRIKHFYYVSASDRCGGGIMFLGCPSVNARVRASVRPDVLPVSTITPERVEGFWPDLRQIFYTTVRRTG